MSVIEENDFFAATDRHYTQGLKISHLNSDAAVPRAIASFDRGIPAWGFEEKASQFGYQLGQSIYTPANLGSQATVPADRPYAGWLYGG